MFCGVVKMTPDDGRKATVKPKMAHFFYMHETDRPKSAVGSVQSDQLSSK